ncbi:uncharacterized protein LOC143459403 isoform X1 [Clavelina lepadiformis]|uniref:uncharacterized protein LOC143459403 isoform X1 n=2 Tax=Clavelina lepadiformis TaxID=159417 RepID=UPI00404380F7
MLYRFAFIVFVLGIFSTVITLQKTSQYRFVNDELFSKLYNGWTGSKSKLMLTRLQRTFSLTDKSYTLPHTQAYTESSLLDQYYKNLFESRDFSYGRRRKLATKNLLIPILYYNMGPNNLFRIFKETISIALSMNRTLVVPPFHHHPRMENLQENDMSDEETMDVAIFDQTYTSAIETEPEKTIDLRALRYLMPTVDIKEYYRKCGEKITTVLTCGLIAGKREEGLEHFKQVLKLTVGRIHRVDNFRDVVEDSNRKPHLSDAIHETRNEHCVGLALGAGCLGSRQSWSSYWRHFSSYVRRPSKIKVLAKQFVEKIFHGKPFLAIHWRYDNEDWQDMCKASRPSSVRQMNKAMCDMANELVTNATSVDFIAKKLLAYATVKNIECIYFAAPPQMTLTLKRLKWKLPNVYIVSDVLKFATINDLMIDVFDNNFSTSFVEQEICYLGAEFLGSPLSSWTQTVMLDRVSEGRGEYGSVLDVIFNDSNAFPKLTWYFPEGT